MKLDSQKQKQFLDKLNGLNHKIVCCVCGKNDWSANDTIFELREFTGGTFVLSGNQAIYPVLPITCNVCGNTHFLNPLKLGLLSQPAQGEKK